MNRISLFLVCVLAISFTGCTDSSKQKVKDASEKMQQAGEDIKDAVKDVTKEQADEWQKFKADAGQKIGDNQKQIDSLKLRLDKANKKLKAQYTQKVNELEQKNAELRKELDDYKGKGQQAWDKFKADFDNQLNQLKTELDDSIYHDF